MVNDIDMGFGGKNVPTDGDPGGSILETRVLSNKACALALRLGITPDRIFSTSVQQSTVSERRASPAAVPLSVT